MFQDIFFLQIVSFFITNTSEDYKKAKKEKEIQKEEENMNRK